MDELLYNLIDDLKSFIRLKTIVGKNKIGYLKHFRGFIEESLDKNTPLDIISLNYDTCIEQFCNFHKKNYQDGFDLYWNKDAFSKAETDIRLYKLHGSVIWYQSDNGAYIKLPIQNGSGELKLISGEKAENLMLYPMQKWDYAEPLLELLLHVKYLLESDIENNTQEDLKSTTNDFKFLIAVGYSFRDGHIKKIILDSAKNNRKLYLIIIDPDANGIYERLKYYDNSREAESDLSGKMICLPYKFEGIFPYLRDYLKNLKDGLNEIRAMQRREDLGNNDVKWERCLKSLANAEHTNLIEYILREKSIEIDNENMWDKMEIFLHIAVNLAINKKNEEAAMYLKNFYKSFYTFYRSTFGDRDRKTLTSIQSAKFPIINLELNNSKNFYDYLKQFLIYSNSRLNISFYDGILIGNLVETMKICEGIING